MPPTPAHLDDSPSQSAIIRLEGVSKSFGRTRALQDITMEVPRGGTTVVLGPSGCGKSVMLKHIIGLLKPDAGRIFYEDSRIDRMREPELVEIRKRVGFLFQQGALFDSMTVGQNIGFALREHTDLPWTERRRKVEHMLELVGVPGTADRMTSELSGGQQKRVALARSVILEPDVVLYDEPTTGLDPIRADVISRLILRLQDRLSLTSVVVTHDIQTAFKIADSMIMMKDGRILLAGPPSLFKDSDDEAVRRFLEGEASPEELGDLAIAPEDTNS